MAEASIDLTNLGLNPGCPGIRFGARKEPRLAGGEGSLVCLSSARYRDYVQQDLTITGDDNDLVMLEVENYGAGMTQIGKEREPIC
jgi:hypothetical protein